MSNIHHQEPQAYGSITIKTTFGDIEVELFTKQCPKATRNFIQLCLDGYYKDASFERVEKDFIAIVGKEDEDDDDVEYFPDEFHSRLRFNRRGLLATANTKKDENGSRFFFTLGSTPELQNKHTIFGRVKGNSIYSLVDLNECEVDEDYCPFSEYKIIDAIVSENPHPELFPRYNRSAFQSKQGDESSSSDDANPLQGPSTELSNTKKKLSYSDDDDDEDDDGKKPVEITLESKSVMQETQVKKPDEVIEEPVKEVNTCLHSSLEEPDQVVDNKEKRLIQIRAQIDALKKQFANEAETKTLSEKLSVKKTSVQTFEKSELATSTKSKKNKNRERETFELVSNFKKKLKEAAKEPRVSKGSESTSGGIEADELAELDKLDSDDWLLHKFTGQDDSILAKDANIKDDDWYTIDDPRHRRHHTNHDRHGRHSSSRQQSKRDKDETRRHHHH